MIKDILRLAAILLVICGIAAPASVLPTTRQLL